MIESHAQSRSQDDDAPMEAHAPQDLRGLMKQLAALPCAARNAYFSALRDEDMSAWRSHDCGGLTFDEQLELCGLLAPALSGHNLARASASFIHWPSARHWGDCVARMASPEEKIALLKAWASQHGPAVQSGPVRSATSSLLSPEPIALAAQALTGLRGHTRHMEAGLSLIAKMTGAYSEGPDAGGQTVNMPEAACTAMRACAAVLAHEPVLLGNLLYASACSTYPLHKAALFAGASEVLAPSFAAQGGAWERIPLGSERAGTLAQAMTHLLCSDTVGMVGTLAVLFHDGRPMVFYVREMLRQGRMDELRVVSEQLRSGHDAATDPAVYLSARDRHGRLWPAMVLGYYVGAAGVACQTPLGSNGLGGSSAGWVGRWVHMLAGALRSGAQDAQRLWISGGAVAAWQQLVRSARGVGSETPHWACEPERHLDAGRWGDALLALALPYQKGAPLDFEMPGMAYVASVQRVLGAQGCANTLHKPVTLASSG
jgi:hypothetical protein